MAHPVEGPTRPPIRIAEAFLSLQGEGPSVGRPAHFVRLQGCSVGCQWCDSKYTWDPSKGEETDLRELEDKLHALGKSELLVITGGEPLEHPDFKRIVDWATSRWKRVEIETSGNRRPPPIPANAVWNWSPKLSGATPNADDTWQFADQFRVTDQYLCKVVVDTEGDWYELLLRLERAHIPPAKVLVMPQGIKADEIAERAQWLAPKCIQSGFRLTPRWHISIWGAKRGV